MQITRAPYARFLLALISCSCIQQPSAIQDSVRNQGRTGTGLQAEEVGRARMKAATLSFLQQQAMGRGSSETYTFMESTWVGSLVHATYQGRLPDFYLYSHSILVVTYQPGTGLVTLLQRE